MAAASDGAEADRTEPDMAELNADLGQRVVIDTASMDWQDSPSPNVQRKRLDLIGPPEAGRVTSVVRYRPGSRFPAHPHPDGEEILVLDGVFADERGRYPAGTYLLNPDGFSHAPFSEEGCDLFVKLRQYPGTGRRHVAVDTGQADWQDGGPGRRVLPLYGEAGYPESTRLVRLAPGTRLPPHDHPGGEEVFVLEGGFEDEFGRYGQGHWLRMPAGSRHRVSSGQGCLMYVKTGHLG